MNVREAIPVDAEKIATVHVQSWKEAYKGIICQKLLSKLDIQERIVFWEKRLRGQEKGKHDFVAVRENGEIVGFASFGKGQPNTLGMESELFAIYILQKYKRMGIGTALLATGVEKLLNEGVNSLLVRVLEDNQNRKFYECFVPEKIAIEKVMVDMQELNEVIYGWRNLSNLLEALIKKSQNWEE